MTQRRVSNVIIGVDRPQHRDRVWLLVNAEPELDGDGRVVQVVATLGDITEHRRLEASLLQARKLESIGRLAGGVAHDFNNLLTVIICTTTLAMRGVHDDDTRENLAQALVAAERAAALTRQLLTFARRQVTAPRSVRIAEVLAAIELLLTRLLGADIELVVDAEPTTWPVRIDPAQLEQIIVNLVVNAREAMPAGGRIRISARGVVHDAAGPTEYVVLRVTDTGRGIDASARSRLFEPFFTTKESGTGLGLATVHGIVTQVGGFITVDSEPGQGATFAIFLPRDLAPTHAAAAAERRAVLGGREAILVVEDEPLVRMLTARALTQAGYAVTEAEDGEDGLRQAAGQPPFDLLVTDLIMPRLDGRALAERLLGDGQARAVLYVSGYADRPLEPGLPFLAKPFTPDELLARVREVLDAGAAVTAAMPGRDQGVLG
jgi:signal transduction histidine kinase/CheY-like chemotaxis protein